MDFYLASLRFTIHLHPHLHYNSTSSCLLLLCFSHVDMRISALAKAFKDQAYQSQRGAIDTCGLQGAFVRCAGVYHVTQSVVIAVWYRTLTHMDTGVTFNLIKIYLRLGCFGQWKNCFWGLGLWSWVGGSSRLGADAVVRSEWLWCTIVGHGDSDAELLGCWAC